MRQFTDIHHHILYGLDDGPKTYLEMTEMLKAASNDGIGTVYATPHITPGVEKFDEALTKRRIDEANGYCEANGLPLRVLSGAEILYTPALENYLADHGLPTLGKTRYVLVEFHPTIPFDDAQRAVGLLNRFNYIPILAHAERYRCLRWRTDRFVRLRSANAVFFQVNCASVLKRNGIMTQRFARLLIRKGLVDCIASDAHDTSARKSDMTNAYDLLNKNGALDRRLFTFPDN